jgi:hypothetical protein
MVRELRARVIPMTARAARPSGGGDSKLGHGLAFRVRAHAQGDVATAFSGTGGGLDERVVSKAVPSALRTIGTGDDLAVNRGGWLGRRLRAVSTG